MNRVKQRGARPRVVIVGGGFAGIEAAKHLGNKDVEVFLIDRRSCHVFQPLLYQVALSVLSPTDISRSIRSILKQYRNIRVLLAEVVDIDRSERRVWLKNGERILYDHLILAAGSTASYFGNHSWASYAPSLKSLEDAVNIQGKILRAFEEAQFAVALGRRQPDLHFVVVGGGPTGVELAGAIAEISKVALQKEFPHMDMARVKITIFEGSPSVLKTFPEDLREKAEQQLEAMGIVVRTGARITDIGTDYVTLEDVRIPASIVLWSAGVAPSALGAKLGCPLDKSGGVIVDQYLNPPNCPEIFVCGDIAVVTEGDRRIPAVAQPAIQMGRYAAQQILAGLSGGAKKPFHYFDNGDMATIGVKKAVARVCWPIKANWSGGMAWLTWLVVHLLFLSGADRRLSVFFSWTYSYLRKTARFLFIVADNDSRSA